MLERPKEQSGLRRLWRFFWPVRWRSFRHGVRWRPEVFHDRPASRRFARARKVVACSGCCSRNVRRIADRDSFPNVENRAGCRRRRPSSPGRLRRQPPWRRRPLGRGYWPGGVPLYRPCCRLAKGPCRIVKRRLRPDRSLGKSQNRSSPRSITIRPSASCGVNWTLGTMATGRCPMGFCARPMGA